MTDQLDSLLELADQAGAIPIDTWGRSIVTVDAPVDLAGLDALAGQAGYTVTAFYGAAMVPLPLGPELLSPRDAADLVMLAANEREASEISGAATSLDIARAMSGLCRQVTIEYTRRGWARTEAAFINEIRTDWAAVADDLGEGNVQVGSTTVETETVVAARAGELAVRIPAGERPTGPEARVWDVVAQIADAAAWTHVAVAVERKGGIHVALHRDQAPVVPLDLTSAAGGVQLLRWLSADLDGNREEAARYVFRQVTAAAPSFLPLAAHILPLAQRQHVALAQTRAAEVFHAIAEGQRTTSDLFETTARSLSDVVDDTAKTGSATLLGVLGLLALVARNGNRLPSWLVMLAALAAVAGIGAVVQSRWGRISDQERAAVRLAARLANDPLLPEDEKAAAEKDIAGFKLADKARGARRWIAVLGAGSCAVALAGAGWLVSSSSTEKPARPAVTTTPTVAPTTHTPSPAATLPVPP